MRERERERERDEREMREIEQLETERGGSREKRENLLWLAAIAFVFPFIEN